MQPLLFMATAKRKKKSLLEFAGTWVGDDIYEVFERAKKDRERLASRTVEM